MFTRLCNERPVGRGRTSRSGALIGGRDQEGKGSRKKPRSGGVKIASFGLPEEAGAHPSSRARTMFKAQCNKKRSACPSAAWFVVVPNGQAPSRRGTRPRRGWTRSSHQPAPAGPGLGEAPPSKAPCSSPPDKKARKSGKACHRKRGRSNVWASPASWSARPFSSRGQWLSRASGEGSRQAQRHCMRA